MAAAGAFVSDSIFLPWPRTDRVVMLSSGSCDPALDLSRHKPAPALALGADPSNFDLFQGMRSNQQELNSSSGVLTSQCRPSLDHVCYMRVDCHVCFCIRMLQCLSTTGPVSTFRPSQRSLARQYAVAALHPSHQPPHPGLNL